MTNLPERHDCCSQGDSRDGIEVGKVREDKMNRSKDHDEVSGLDVFAIFSVLAHKVMDFLQWFSSSDHVHNVHTNFTYQLLWHHNPETQLLPKGMLPQLMVPVKPFPRDHLMHLHHLPQCVECDYPWQHKNHHTRTPVTQEITKLTYEYNFFL